jgi:hypothetical protein
VRWTDLFATFDLDINYKPGRENIVPDALSRRPDLRSVSCAPDLKIVSCALFNSKRLPDTDFLRRLREALSEDPVCAQLIQAASQASSSYRCISGLLYVLDEKCYRLYIPADSSLKYLLLCDYHTAPSAAHPGVQRTYEDLKQYFYWPKMMEDLRNFVGSCRHC